MGGIQKYIKISFLQSPTLEIGLVVYDDKRCGKGALKKILKDTSID